jgi:predicted GTPase
MGFVLLYVHYAILSERYKLFGKFLDEKDVDYLVMDYKIDYNPDIVGDIHAVSMQTKSVD